jgi:membrane-bound lytic murein transglycosylase B
MLTKRQNYRILTIIICTAMGLQLLSPAYAQKSANNTNNFVMLQKQLTKDGFNANKIKRLYARSEVSFESKGVSLFFIHSEAKLDYNQFSNDRSIRKAKKYMHKHQAQLTRTENAYKVDKKIITAILLVETRLGTYVGKRSTLNTLSTMASLSNPKVKDRFWQMIPQAKRLPRKEFEKKAASKSKWAYRELKAFLTYSFREGYDPTTIPGSYAGAVGIPQFMPSNILAYAKDGNQDGKIDLLNHADAIASVANYLKRNGWRPGLSQKKAKKVIYSYNHSQYYVATILKIAELLEG